MTEALHRDVQPLRGNVVRRHRAPARGRRVLRAEPPAAFLSRRRFRSTRTCGCSTRCRRSRSRNGHDAGGAQPRWSSSWPRRWPRRRGVAARDGGRQRRAHAAACRHDVDRRRRAATRDEFLSSLRQGLGRPGGRARHGRQRVAGDAYGVIGRLSSRSLAGLGPRDHPRAGGARPAWRSPARRCRCSSCRWSIAWPGKRASGARSTQAARRRPAPRGPAQPRSRSARCEARRVSTRVAITGIGLVTGAGATREESWRRMLAGECGIRPTTVFDTEGYRSRVARGGRHGRDRRAAPTPLERRRRSRSDRIGAARAPPRRVHDAGLLDRRCRSLARRRLPRRRHRRPAAQRGVLSDLDHGGPRPRAAVGRLESFSRARRSTSIAERFGFEGPRACVVAACSSSTIAIGRAVEAIRAGRADAALAGGTDALSRLTFSGFNLLRLMDPAPCRPFDRSRAGMNIGEGAGMLVLEDLDRARAGAARRSTPSSRATASRARRFIRPRREPEGRAGRRRRQPRRCATRASTPTRSITSTRTAPPRRRTTRAEARGFRRVFGERGRRHSGDLDQVDDRPLPGRGRARSRPPSLALTIARGVIPPTIHHARPTPDCAVDVVANEAREQPRAVRGVDVARLRRQRLRVVFRACRAAEVSNRRRADLQVAQRSRGGLNQPPIRLGGPPQLARRPLTATGKDASAAADVRQSALFAARQRRCNAPGQVARSTRDRLPRARELLRAARSSRASRCRSVVVHRSASPSSACSRRRQRERRRRWWTARA